ncbi:maleylpyruvate isomerase family mycothiol-dependent enzyme [Streptomyces sp. HNM0574]|uniref:maleylpyruvate isomerase family mycothiol-dependent enzyme n=1 Tax=Streptomyces sp. HNM0574 TaxID=2714954 RepID=UPI00146E1E6D|nr:maleylpyruvate isomerase family mycothiol-dependent enzyme [Streptomyces sp. HNM0574]NLU68290.1 maleylpyruvate isomerase family mycothiol-dependent enzyme [Streptomyces sp. HNM0574]
MPAHASGRTEERQALTDAVSRAADRFSELLLSAPDPGARVPATPDWSVTDVLGHVAMEPGRYRELALGRGTWPARVADLPAFNAEQVRTLPTRDPDGLARILRRDVDALLSTVEGFGEEPPLMFFDGDQRVRADRALGTLLGEFVIHGHDVATLLGRPWPIAPELVPLVMTGLHQVLPGWVDPARAAGHTAVYELRLRGLTRYVYRFDDGRLTVDPATPGRVDVTLSADPATALLLNYGRTGRWRAALTGRITARGRRPWLAPGLTGRFRSA